MCIRDRFPCERSFFEFGDRDGDGEGAAAAELAVDIDAPAVRFNDMLHQREAESAPATGTRKLLVHLIEAAKNVFAFGLREAEAIVLNADEDVARGVARAEVDALFLAGVFHGLS